jgi:hypothetical protein
MGRDDTRYERNERRGFGGPDDWDRDLNEGIDERARDRPTQRSGWQGTPVTGYRGTNPRDRRDRDDWDEYDQGGRQRPVYWGRQRRDAGSQPSHGYELDHDVYRAGDRDEWRGEFGAKEDRTQWGRGRDRRWGETMRGAVREGRDWLASGRDRYRDWRETGGDPYREQRDQYEGTRYGMSAKYPAHSGRYAGVGPRGYQRTDARIREDVSEILWRDAEIDASDIDVTVENGEVTLEGTVETRWTKRLAEDDAWAAGGVYDVHNRLRISRERRDPDVTSTRDTSGVIRMEGGRLASSPRFRVDMSVVGSDGDEVGIIKEVREDTILVDRPMARDIYIPTSAVQDSDSSTARLNVDSGEVDNQGWHNPPMTGTDTDYDDHVELT